MESNSLAQVLCKAQRRAHSRSNVTGAVTKHDCTDAGGRATQEQLSRVSEQGVRIFKPRLARKCMFL